MANQGRFFTEHARPRPPASPPLMPGQATLSLSEARKRLNTIDNELSMTPIIYVVRHGKRVFALVAAELISAMLATYDIMADPAWRNALQQSLRDIQAGQLHDHDDVVRELG